MIQVVSRRLELLSVAHVDSTFQQSFNKSGDYMGSVCMWSVNIE